MGFALKLRGWHATLPSVAICVVVGTLLWLTFSPAPISSDVPCFDASDLGHSSSADFLLALDQNGNLLIAQQTLAQQYASPRLGTGEDRSTHRFEVQTVYRYDRTTQTLAVVDKSAWARATSAVSDLVSEMFRPEGLSLGEGEFVVGETHVPVKGKRAVAWRVASDRTLLAIVSADGAKRPPSEPLLPFIGGGRPVGAYGQHYVEFFTFPELAPVGEPVKISLTTARGTVRLRLSPRGEYCVCWSYASSRVCIVPTGHAATTN